MFNWEMIETIASSIGKYQYNLESLSPTVLTVLIPTKAPSFLSPQLTQNPPFLHLPSPPLPLPDQIISSPTTNLKFLPRLPFPRILHTPSNLLTSILHPSSQIRQCIPHRLSCTPRRACDGVSESSACGAGDTPDSPGKAADGVAECRGDEFGGARDALVLGGCVYRHFWGEMGGVVWFGALVLGCVVNGGGAFARG